MSLIMAKKGIYNPKKVLKNKIWSILKLNLLDKKILKILIITSNTIEVIAVFINYFPI
jgi:hypothetical protein